MDYIVAAETHGKHYNSFISFVDSHRGGIGITERDTGMEMMGGLLIYFIVLTLSQAVAAVGNDQYSGF